MGGTDTQVIHYKSTYTGIVYPGEEGMISLTCIQGRAEEDRSLLEMYAEVTPWGNFEDGMDSPKGNFRKAIVVRRLHLFPAFFMLPGATQVDSKNTFCFLKSSGPLSNLPPLLQPSSLFSDSLSTATPQHPVLKDIGRRKEVIRSSLFHSQPSPQPFLSFSLPHKPPHPHDPSRTHH